MDRRFGWRVRIDGGCGGGDASCATTVHGDQGVRRGRTSHSRSRRLRRPPERPLQSSTTERLWSSKVPSLCVSFRSVIEFPFLTALDAVNTRKVASRTFLRRRSSRSRSFIEESDESGNQVAGSPARWLRGGSMMCSHRLRRSGCPAEPDVVRQNVATAPAVKATTAKQYERAIIIIENAFMVCLLQK